MAKAFIESGGWFKMVNVTKEQIRNGVIKIAIHPPFPEMKLPKTKTFYLAEGTFNGLLLFRDEE